MPDFPGTCNICGTALAPGIPDREAANCPACSSNTRLRSLIALLSNEIFGTALSLTEFPVLKSIRGLGMSDNPEIARRLAEKFDYTNTFYHQAPYFDATKLDEGDRGRYDFILSSEVMEHVPPPVERSFENLAAMLKPDGVLLFTTPYEVDGKTLEHFPELHDFTLANLGGRMVLINRTTDGRTQVFDDLTFHGGRGSTLEMRVFSRESLEQTVLGAGFREVHFAAEQWPEFGIDHSETWSLPVAARKGKFQVPVAELARQFAEIASDRNVAEAELQRIEQRWWSRLGRRLGVL
jgi:SAM-dependent methyltransferase